MAQWDGCATAGAESAPDGSRRRREKWKSLVSNVEMMVWMGILLERHREHGPKELPIWQQELPATALPRNVPAQLSCTSYVCTSEDVEVHWACCSSFMQTAEVFAAILGFFPHGSKFCGS